MKMKRNLIKLLSLGIFTLTIAFASNNVGLAQEPNSNSSDSDYGVGALLKVGSKGAAVYQIGSDGKKYVYPDQKTFETWHDDFSKVIAVSLDVLDKYSDGGSVTFQPGTKLITHRNTSKVYAVGKDGEVFYIPNEATARKFYGNEWYKIVVDIDPGVFALNYKINDQELSEDNLPEESLVQVEGTGDYFIIENGQKRKVSTEAFGPNGLYRKNVLKLKKMPAIYNDGDDVVSEEEDISNFDPGADDEKITICHKATVASQSDGVTIKVSSRALAAHLAHGDTRGACSNDDDEDDSGDIPSCSNPRIVDKVALRTKYWQNLGLNTSAHPEIYQYQIQWFSGYWSPWYTPGVDDVDWVLSNRRVWSYFEDHNYRLKICQGVNDPTLPDIMVSDISLEPSHPQVNATVTIKVHVKNNGQTTLTSTNGILSGAKSFQDFSTTPLPGRIPTTSEANPLRPGETTYITWTGHFTSVGEKRLEIEINANGELEESDDTNNVYSEYVTVLAAGVDPVLLSVCDHNGDGLRNLTDVALFSECAGTFDGNGDGVHDLTDISLYGNNNQSNTWCATSFMCEAEEAQSSQQTSTSTLAICDHNSDGLRNLSDVALFAECVDTFDANDDGLHDLSDASLYSSNNQSNTWCANSFVCHP